MYYEGLDEFEIARRPLAQPQLAERFNAIDGNVYHVDPVITRLGPLRPALGMGGYKTPVEGLWMSGSGTHSIPGISGMPGHNAAKTMIRQFRKEDGVRRGPFRRPGGRLRPAPPSRVASVSNSEPLNTPAAPESPRPTPSAA